MSRTFDLNLNRIVVSGARVVCEGQYDGRHANARLSNGLTLNISDPGTGRLDILVSRPDGKGFNVENATPTLVGQKVENVSTEDVVVVDTGIFRRKTRINFFPRQ